MKAEGERALRGQYTFSTPEQSVPRGVECYLLAVTALLTVNALKSVVRPRSESLLQERYMPPTQHQRFGNCNLQRHKR